MNENILSIMRSKLFDLSNDVARIAAFLPKPGTPDATDRYDEHYYDMVLTSLRLAEQMLDQARKDIFNVEK